MQTERKTQLVQDWGFKHSVAKIYVRDIYKDQGYLEFWTEAQPDLIQIFKNGDWSEDYPIDWSLFS